MIDTIRLLLDASPFERGPGWTETQSRKVISNDLASVESDVVLAQHEDSGARIGGSLGGSTWLEVSLPRLVYGSNDRVLRFEDITPAIEAARELASQVHRRADVICVTRLDIAGHHPAKAGDAIAAHRTTRHPRIRAQACEWFGESIHWIGRELHGRLYDKEKECGRPSGDYFRMEWQMRGSALKSAITGNKKRRVELQDVTPSRVYSTYRTLCLGLAPQVLQRPRSIYELIAVGEELGWRDKAGRSILEIYESARSARTARRIRNYVAAARPDSWGIDWSAWLPLDRDRATILWDAQRIAA